MARDPLSFLIELTEDDDNAEFESTAYELYRVEMDAKFEKLDAELSTALWRQAKLAQWKGAAFDKIVHSLLPLVPHICSRLQAKYGRPNKDQWDDCIQAGNLALLQAIRSWNPEGGTKLSSWVYQYAHRDIGRELVFLEDGAHPLLRPQSDIDEPQESDNGELAAQMERDIDYRKMRDKVMLLSEQQRSVVNLLLSGKNIADAARILGITRQAAHALHERAVIELRRLMLTNV